MARPSSTEADMAHEEEASEASIFPEPEEGEIPSDDGCEMQEPSEDEIEEVSPPLGTYYIEIDFKQISTTSQP